MTRSLAIGFDADDVLFPWSQYAHEEIVAAGKDNGATITRWSMHEDYGLTSEAFWTIINEAYRRGMLLRAPVAGAVEALEGLVALGHTIHIVTARGTSEHSSVRALVRSDTWNWLHRYKVPYHSLTFTADKASVDVDYFVDDNLGHYAALDALGRKVFLMDAIHNQVPGCTRRRVKSVAEYVEQIKSMEEMERLVAPAVAQSAALSYYTMGACK